MKFRLSLACILLLQISLFGQETDPVEFEYPFAEPGSQVTRGVFGKDDRKEVKDADGYEDFVRATAVMVSKKSAYNNEYWAWSLRDLLKQKFGTDKFADDVKFLDQPTVGSCTGFLIAPDIMVTAGHCVNSMQEANQFVWIFDYTSESDFIDGNRLRFKKENIFEVESILTSTLDDKTRDDYAVLRLKRKSDRKPYRFRTSGTVMEGSAINTIGCPTGLPLKFSTNAVVVDNSPKNWFKSNIDSFPGNSGGPVFDKNGFIEGILVRGAVTYSNGEYTGDYRYDASCDCVKTVQWNSVTWTAGCQAHKINEMPSNVLVQAIYENLEYAIKNNDRERFNSWKVYSWIFNSNYAKSAGMLENLAISYNALNIFKEIVEINAKNYSDDSARDLIDAALKKNNTTYLKVLLDAGLLADAGYNSRLTPLQYAVANNKADAAKMLIAYGANINKKTANGDNLLHLVAESGNIAMAEYLVSKGINAGERNSNRKRPEQIAKKNKYRSLAKFLKKARKRR